MGKGQSDLLSDTPTLMRYVDILATDKDKSLSLNLNTMEKNTFLFSNNCDNCTSPNGLEYN